MAKKKRKKPRPRLHQEDRVKVVKVPEKFKRRLGRTGVIISPQRDGVRMWMVKLKNENFAFFRHELKKLVKR